MSESLEDRLTRERAERKAESAKASEMKDARRAAQRNFTNPARREEAQTRFKELLSPSRPAARASSPSAPPVSGEPLPFYVYKGGELKILKLMLIP